MEVEAAVLAVRSLYPRVWHTAHEVHPTDRSAVSPRDLAILVHLAEGGVSPTRLAEHLGVSGGTLSDALSDLDERGLVTRTRHGDDRRRVAVGLTEAGRDAIALGSGLDPARLERALAALTSDERALVVDGLGLLARACTALRSAP